VISFLPRHIAEETMVTQDMRNVSIVVGGSLAMMLVLVGGFILLCTVSWAVMYGMDYGFEQLGFPRRFGGENGPAGLEILIGAFLILALRRLTHVTRAED
jgi:hypothetical protein